MDKAGQVANNACVEPEGNKRERLEAQEGLLAGPLRLKLSAILVLLTFSMMLASAFMASERVAQWVLISAEQSLRERNELLRHMMESNHRHLENMLSLTAKSLDNRLGRPIRLQSHADGRIELVAGTEVIHTAHDDLTPLLSREHQVQGLILLTLQDKVFHTYAISLRESLLDLPGHPRFPPDSAVHELLMSQRPATTFIKEGGYRYLLHLRPLVSEQGKTIGAVGAMVDMQETFSVVREVIQSVRIGRTGYSYALNARQGPGQGDLLVHPAQEGRNIAGVQDSEGRFFIREILDTRNGVIRYPWLNKELNETVPREKIVAYFFFEPWGWIVGSGSYVDELTEMAERVKYLVVGSAVLVAALLALLLHFLIQRWVLVPLVNLKNRLQEGEERWNFALEGTGDAVWDWQMGQNTLVASRRYFELLGLPAADLPLPASFREMRIHPLDRDEVYRRMVSHMSGQTPVYVSEHRLRREDGSYLWVLERGKVMQRQPSGAPARFIGTLADISERKRFEAEQRLWANVFSDSSEGILIMDSRYRVVSANTALLRMTGFEESDLVGSRPTALFNSDQERNFLTKIFRLVSREGRWQGEVLCQRKQGGHFPVQAFVTTVREPDGSVSNRVAILSDVSERKQAEAQVEFLAHHDPLTGLPNRNLVRQRLATLIHEGNDAKGSLLLLGLDGFQKINDSLGRHHGDHLLRTVSERLTHQVRKGDFVGRLTGDEFLVILPRCAALEDVRRVLDLLLKTVAEPVLLGEMELAVSASVGVSLYPDHGRDPEKLILDAESALHTAKSLGRGQVVIFKGELNEKVSERLTLENQIRVALQQNQFMLNYQPQVDLMDGRVIAVEALIRWKMGNDWISPMRFIPVAEESGLIIPLGDWVLRQACRQHNHWISLGLPPVRVAVNISAVQFRQIDFVSKVRSILEEEGVGAEHIELEITESLMLEDLEATIAQLKQLKQMGFQLAIDDFGTGYSSMSYLSMLPVDRLKIDQSFIRASDAGQTEAAIVKTIIALGRNLGLQVIAEGVETADQANRLWADSCQEGQGYFFARPMPDDVFVSWLSKYSSEAHKPGGVFVSSTA